MSSVASRLASKPARKPSNKQVRLRLVYIDFWSAVKLSFLMSLVFGIVLVVVAFVLWTVLNNFGLFNTINEMLTGIVDNNSKSGVQKGLGLGTVMGGAVVIAILDVIVLTALGAVSALLYNLSVRITGGLLVGFSNN